MDNDLAKRLEAELEKHPKLEPWVFTDENRDSLIRMLVATDVPKSERFYEEIKPDPVRNSYSVVLGEHYMDSVAILSLRRVLRNTQALNYELSWLKSIYEAGISALGVFGLHIYDSDVLTRKLRVDEHIVRMMAESHGPNSLLGKLKIVNGVSRKVSEGPILIIPDARDSSKILGWGDRNTTYYEEGRIVDRRISRAHYLRI